MLELDGPGYRDLLGLRRALIDVGRADSAVQVSAVNTLLTELGQQSVLHELDQPSRLPQAAVHLLRLLHLDVLLSGQHGGVLHEPEPHIDHHAAHLEHGVLPDGGHTQHALAPAESEGRSQLTVRLRLSWRK